MRSLEKASSSNTCRMCLLLIESGTHCIECKNVQLRHFSIELFRLQVYTVLVNLGFLPLPQHIKLRQHPVRDGTRQTKATTSRICIGLARCSTTRAKHQFDFAAVTDRDHPTRLLGGLWKPSKHTTGRAWEGQNQAVRLTRMATRDAWRA